MSKIKLKKHRKLIHYLPLVPLILILALTIGVVLYAQSPIDDNNSTITVEIPTGSSFIKVTEILKDEGVVKSRVLFYGLAVMKRALRSIRAGEYEFNTAQTPTVVIEKLMRGEIKYYKVTIPEDFTLREIAERLKSYKLIDEEDFFELCTDEEFIKSLGVNAESLEGYLFPDTYHFNRAMSTRQILRTMVSHFYNKVTPEMIGKAAQRGFTLHEFVTFASIVGKESGNNEEKPLIAAVFYNRLRKKMPLQSDPTAVYDLEDFNGKVLRKHLKRNSPYNTYIIRSLPPGPIANPGTDSLLAALNPASVDYLYFVSKKDGSHFFSSSLQTHNDAIGRYRRTKNIEMP